MLRHSRFSRVVPCARLQTALRQTGQLFWTDLAPTPPLAASEDEGGGLELSEGACQQDVPSQECMVTPGSPPTSKCQEPWKMLPEKHPKGHSAPQAPSQRLLLHETPALPVGSVIPSSRGTRATKASLVPCPRTPSPCSSLRSAVGLSSPGTCPGEVWGGAELPRGLWGTTGIEVGAGVQSCGRRGAAASDAL